MEVGAEAKAVNHVLSPTANNLKTIGMPYLAPGKTKMQKIVIAKFKYRDPTNGKEFTVQRGWPCKDQTDAEHIIKYYGMKTGALGAECVMEEVEYEKSK